MPFSWSDYVSPGRVLRVGELVTTDVKRSRRAVAGTLSASGQEALRSGGGSDLGWAVDFRPREHLRWAERHFVGRVIGIDTAQRVVYLRIMFSTNYLVTGRNVTFRWAGQIARVPRNRVFRLTPERMRDSGSVEAYVQEVLTTYWGQYLRTIAGQRVRDNLGTHPEERPMVMLGITHNRLKRNSVRKIYKEYGDAVAELVGAARKYAGFGNDFAIVTAWANYLTTTRAILARARPTVEQPPYRVPAEAVTKFERYLEEGNNLTGLNIRVHGVCGHLVPSEGSLRIHSAHSMYLQLERSRVTFTNVAETGRLCPVCAERRRAELVVDNDNTEDANDPVYLVRSRAHHWHDGTWHDHPEPDIIGSYHTTSRRFTRPLPHMNGRAVTRLERPLVGYELEFIRHNPSHPDQWYAREMHSRVAVALKDVVPSEKYMGFERDGSVDFELVSCYGPLDIHRTAIRAMFHDDPFEGSLRSHNGGRCGLHVHLDKPTSFLHAAKMTAFYHARENEALIKAVARRYGQGYCQVHPDKAKMDTPSGKALVKEIARSVGGRVTRIDHLRNAISRLSTGRYEALNWGNPKTVEVRIFRGSMRVESIIACLEFAYLSWLFCRDVTSRELSSGNFLDFIGKPEWRKESAFLRRYLTRKGYRVWMPNAQAARPAQKLVNAA